MTAGPLCELLQTCVRSPYKVVQPRVYDMQLLADRCIYQERGISPPCMVLLLAVAAASTSACFLSTVRMRVVDDEPPG